ncbi:MAG: hypothetical protein ACRD9L_11590 [Bryobacteraceae bacterium]
MRGGWEGLIERWEKFVAEVERGYPFGLEDYRNDLDLRGIIALIGFDDRVRALDERFKKLLTVRDQRIWESTAGDPFWDFGYPNNAGEALLEDLRAEGLL